ncbi:MAG: nitrile hydratase subunit beta [Pseudomonadales bacterium]
MDGIHDLGGKQGFGPVEIDDLPVGFHERWHAAVFTMVSAAFASGAAKNTDHFRHAVERIDPISYLTHGYYGRWLGGIENMLVEGGVISQAELDQHARSLGARASARVAARPSLAQANPPETTAARDTSARRSLSSTPRFDVGHVVFTRNQPSRGHTRLPAYARGAGGVIAGYQGAWVLPDASAHGEEQVEHLYSVRFAAQTLFGDDANEMDEIHLDLFESYLQAS